MVALIGRDAEMRLVEDRLTADPAISVVLAGRAGVGKSRLAAEIAARLAASERPIRRIAVTESLATIPFGAFAEQIPSDVPLSSAPLDLLRAVGDGLAALGSAAVVVIDDAHLLDAGSAALVHQLVSGRSITVLLTVRSGTHAPDAVTRLWTEGLAERTELQSLSRAEVEELLVAMLGGPVEEVTVARLADASDGNVLYLSELVGLGRDQGALRHEHGAWVWVGGIVPSGRLTDLIEQALAGAPPDVRPVLETVALSEPVGSDLVARAVGDRALERALHSRFLANEVDGRRSTVRLAHPLFAEALRTGLGPARRRTISRLLAEALRSGPGRRRSDRMRLPEWLLEGGVAGQADADILARAAWETYGSAPKLAERFARAAVDGGAGFDALLALAVAMNWQGRFEDCVRIAAPLLDRAEHDFHRRQVGVHVGLTLVGLRRADEAEAFVRRAEEACLDRRWRLYLTEVRARILVMTARIVPGLALAEQVMADPAVDEEASLRATATAGIALVASGQVRRALTLLEDALPRAFAAIDANTVPLSEGAVRVIGLHLEALQHAGRLDDTDAIITQIRGFADAAGSHYIQAAADLAGGPAALRRGRPRTAARLLQRYLRAFDHEDPGVNTGVMISLAEASALTGDTDAATAAERVLCRPSTTAQLDDTEIARARAWVAVAAGELSRAAALLDDAASIARAAGLVLYEADALHDRWRVTGETDAGRLDELAAVADGAAWVDAAAATARAVVTDDPDAWDRAAVGFASIGADLHAAEVWTAAAACCERAGLRARANSARTRAATLVAACEGARTPALRAAAFPPVGSLTQREREIVELAARGLSNREIAERLVVSIRTVEGHLGRAYTKLGTSDRADLAALLDLPETASSDS